MRTDNDPVIVGFLLNTIECFYFKGLDPAGPWFEHGDLSVGLNPSSADLVDVIHTDGGWFLWYHWYGLGMLKAIGHIDFYPNGGTYQPGCLMSYDSMNALHNCTGLDGKTNTSGK